MNPKPEHTLDARILGNITKIVLYTKELDSKKLVATLEEFERDVQLLLKQEWDKSKNEAVTGSLHVNDIASQGGGINIMDPRINIATIFLTIALASIAGTLTGLMNSGVSICLTTYFFVVFFIILRIKFYLDDISDFLKTTNENSVPKFSLVVGLISWLFWLLSALNLKNLNSAILFLFIAISIATVAVLPLCYWNKSEMKYKKWIGFNLAYLSMLFLLWYFSPWQLIQQIVFYAAGILIAFFDFASSGSLKILTAAPNNQNNKPL